MALAGERATCSWEVVFTVEGENERLQLRNEAGARVMAEAEELTEMSLPIANRKGSVVRAGEGFITLLRVRLTVAIADVAGTAPVIVKLLPTITIEYPVTTAKSISTESKLGA